MNSLGFCTSEKDQLSQQAYDPWVVAFAQAVLLEEEEDLEAKVHPNVVLVAKEEMQRLPGHLHHQVLSGALKDLVAVVLRPWQDEENTT